MTANATISAGHLIDSARNRVTVLGSSANDGYVRVRFEDGAESTFPAKAVVMDEQDDEAVFEQILDLEIEHMRERAVAAMGTPDGRWNAQQRMPKVKNKLYAALGALTPEQQVRYGQYRKASMDEWRK